VIDPQIVRREWTREEDLFILQQHQRIGSKWSQISKMDPLLGRTVSQIKNRFYQNLKDKDISEIRYKVENPQKHNQTHKKKKCSKGKENSFKDFQGLNKRDQKTFMKNNVKE
jgi:hypothetical protein